MKKQFDEIYLDAWQLYSTFVHSSARTRIESLDSTLVETFSRAIDEKSLDELERTIERVGRRVQKPDLSHLFQLYTELVSAFFFSAIVDSRRRA